MKELDTRHYPIELDALPPGWAVAAVGEGCVDIRSGFASGEHNSSGRGVPHLRPMNVDRAGRINLDEVKSVAAAVDERRLAAGDVLFNNTNSPALVGKTAPVPNAGEFAFSNHMTRLKPGAGVDPRFLAHEIHYLWMSGYFLHKCQKHVNQASISSDVLATTVPMAYPPAPEQIRIVAAIESYLTRLDAAVAGLERAQRNLKRYRASVLKAAVEGRLVPTEAELSRAEGRDYEPASVLLERILAERRKRWQEAGGKGKYKEPVAPDTSGLPELPEGWCWARAEQICGFITKGTTPPSAAMAADRGEVPFIKVYNLTSHGQLDFSVKPTFVDVRVHQGLLGRSRVVPGDLLMNIVGPPLGKVAIVPDSYPEWNMNQAVAVFRPLPGLFGRYLSLCLQTPSVLQSIIARAKTTAGQVNLTLELCRDLPLPLPPLAEQRRIADEADRCLTISDAAQRQGAANEARSGRLRQSILKWAFEGRLVGQNSDDEPASVLLERIRAERGASAASGLRRPKGELRRERQTTQSCCSSEIDARDAARRS